MSYLWTIGAIVLAVVGSALAARLFGTADAQQLLERIQPIDMEVLREATVYAERDLARDRQLWLAMHGARGLIKIWINCGIILSITRIFAEHSPEDATEDYRLVSRLALRLRYCVLVALVEGAFQSAFTSVPRFYLRFSLQVYSEMVISVTTLFDQIRPDLGERVDSIF